MCLDLMRVVNIEEAVKSLVRGKAGESCKGDKIDGYE